MSVGGVAAVEPEEERQRRVSDQPDHSGAPDTTVAAPRGGERLAGLGEGDPLPGSDRRWLERSFGRSLGDVRVHDGPAAHAIVEHHGAVGAALGSDVVLGRGVPAFGLGRRALLAHEVAHTVQQTGGGSASDAALEADADRAAVGALLGTVDAAPARTGGGLQLSSCADIEFSMTEEELEEFIAQNHLRIVVTQPTTRFLTGMKKSVAVAGNEESGLADVVKREDDHLVTYGTTPPSVRSVYVEMPFPGGERSSRALALHGRTGTFTLSFMFPGRYDITANVVLGHGRVETLRRSIDVQQSDFVGESDRAAPGHLAGQAANTPDVERIRMTLQRADIRERAVTAGILDRAVADAWTDLSMAVVVRSSALQTGGTGPGTATEVSDAVAAFQRSFGTVPDELRAPISLVAGRANSTSWTSLRTAVEMLVSAFDTWVLARLRAHSSGADLATQFQHTIDIEREVASIARRARGGAVKIPAIFHPEASYVRREVFAAEPYNLGEIVPVPLNLWLFSEGGDDWTLRDVSNPTESFEYDTTNTDRDAALDNLLRQLSTDEERWPNGRLHVTHPARGAVAFATESDMDIEDWIGVAALILAAAGIIMVTAGAATPAVVAVGGYLLTASAVAGAALAVYDTASAYERGRLTAGRLTLNSLQFVASIATAGSARILAQAARSGSNLALLGSNARYIMLNRVATGADVLTLAVMTGDTVATLAAMSQNSRRDDQAALRAALAIGQLLIQGSLTIVSARNDFSGDLSGNPHVELHEGADGNVTVRNPGAAAAPGAGAAAPGAATTPDAPPGPRVAEDLLAPGAAHFADAHEPLRTAYDRYVARCRARNEEPLGPMQWLLFQTNGPAARYLDATLPEGWRAARRAQYPGSRPELIDRPSMSPPEGSVDPTTGNRWRYRRVSVDDIRPEVDATGDPYWTFPDLVDGEVLILPSGTRVWKDPPTGAIVEEHPVGPSVTSQRTRTRGEATVMDREEMGPGHAEAGTERAHGAASPGLGFDSPYSVAHAPRSVNQTLENHGIEAYVRRLRDNTPPGVQYVFTTRTHKRGQNLTERIYDIAAIHDGNLHPMFRFKIEVTGTPPNLRARFVADEASAYSGAEAFGSPPLRTPPANTPDGATPGVEVPRTLRDAMGRAGRASAPARAPVDPAIEQIGRSRQALDDLLEARIRAGTATPGWVDAQDAARQALDDAEERLRTAIRSTSDGEELRRMMTELNTRAGRHPHTVDEARLRAFAERVGRLELD